LIDLVHRTALIGVLVLAMSLAACGRKGGLDAPPSAAIDQPVPDAAGVAPKPDAPYNTTVDGRPLAPSVAKKRLPIDWLLD
jgi:predicted small lipoprotein YifL